MHLILGRAGQVLSHVPRGVASGATWVLENTSRPTTDAERVLASGNADAASWVLTTTATAGPTQARGDRISVSSTTGASVGAHALLLAADGRRELLEVVAVSANSYVQASSSLAGVYPTGSTVRGVDIEASITDEITSDEDLFDRRDPLRIKWTYTIDGALWSVVEKVEFQRHDAAAAGLIGEALVWLARTYPDLRERLPEGADLDRIAEAMQLEVELDIRARNESPERMLIGDHGRALLSARVLAHLAELGWSPGATADDRWIDTTFRRYRNRLEDLFTGLAGQGTASTTRDDIATGNPDPKTRTLFRTM